MFNKMIAQQTAKKEKLLDNFLKKHEAEYPFPEDVELICDIDYMGDGKPCHFMDIYRPRKIMKENFQSCLTCTEAVFSLEKKKRDFSSLLYLRETLEKEFVLSIYKSGKQRNYPKPATVISGHSLRRYSSKLQQTVCKSDKKSRCDLSS